MKRRDFIKYSGSAAALAVLPIIPSLPEKKKKLDEPVNLVAGEVYFAQIHGFELGDEVIICDSNGKEYKSTITKIDNGMMEARF